jgi:hypothetical protein
VPECWQTENCQKAELGSVLIPLTHWSKSGSQ